MILREGTIIPGNLSDGIFFSAASTVGTFFGGPRGWVHDLVTISVCTFVREL